MIMIKEEHVRLVAQATVTDDCRVEVELRKRRQSLTTTQALSLAEEIVKAAAEASVALAELVHPVVPAGFDFLPVPQAIISPDCRDGKHLACIGGAWSDVVDAEAACECSCHHVAATGRAA